jgi:hypothetical protein
LKIVQVDVRAAARDKIVAELMAFSEKGLAPLNVLCRLAARTLGFNAAVITLRPQRDIRAIGRYGLQLPSFDITQTPDLYEMSMHTKGVIESLDYQKDLPIAAALSPVLGTMNYWYSVPIFVEDMLVARLNLFDQTKRNEPMNPAMRGVAEDFASMASMFLNTHRLLRGGLQESLKALDSMNEI